MGLNDRAGNNSEKNWRSWKTRNTPRAPDEWAPEKRASETLSKIGKRVSKRGSSSLHDDTTGKQFWQKFMERIPTNLGSGRSQKLFLIDWKKYCTARDLRSTVNLVDRNKIKSGSKPRCSYLHWEVFQILSHALNSWQIQKQWKDVFVRMQTSEHKLQIESIINN